MTLPENDFQILRLSDAFFIAYPNPPYTEILQKRERAYNCLLFQSNYDYFICIPFRTEITHPYAYHFRKSARSRKHKSGLDYSKIVIVSKLEYIDSRQAVVDQDEYRETVIQIEKIKQEAFDFVQEYVLHVNGTKLLPVQEFKRRYAFSPLRYFHQELGFSMSSI